MVLRGASSVPMAMGLAYNDVDEGNSIDDNGDSSDQYNRSRSDNGNNRNEPLHTTLRCTFSSTFSLSSSSPSSPGTMSRRRLLKKSSLRKSLRRLDSSHRLSITCSGSDLSQLYLSSPEQDAMQNVLQSPPPSSFSSSNNNMNNNNARRGSWVQAADLYGQRKSFRRISSYARFLDIDIMSEIVESSDGTEEEERMLLIEETYGDDEYRLNQKDAAPVHQRCIQRLQSPAIVVPTMMIVDLILGVSLSLYDSNLLMNVPGFRFPLCYALTQKLTNALASLVLICLSRRWEMEEKARGQRGKKSVGDVAKNDDQLLMEVPSMWTFRQHLIPLSAVALVQTISAAFANQALQIIPLPLFKVCLMCGPIFVAFLTSMVEGQLYSKGRLLALSLIGVGACRAVYAEAEGADNPRYIMEGACYALGASAFSGIGLVLSSVLMHRGGNDQDEEEDDINHLEQHSNEKVDAKPAEVELNPLSLLFYLSCEQVLMLSAYLCPWDILLERENEAADAMVEKELGEFAAFTMYFAENPWMTVSYLMTGSMMSLFLAVLTFVLVNRTSPVATSLLGNVRSIATVAISSVVFGSHASGGLTDGSSGLFGSAAFGYSLTLAGGVGYAMAALGRDSSPSK